MVVVAAKHCMIPTMDIATEVLLWQILFNTNCWTKYARWDANWCNRGTKGFPGNYGENRIFDGPTTLIETAFMDNISKNNALQNPEFRDIITDGIREGILEYYSTPMATITSPHVSNAENRAH